MRNGKQEQERHKAKTDRDELKRTLFNWLLLRILAVNRYLYRRLYVYMYMYIYDMITRYGDDDDHDCDRRTHERMRFVY